MGDSKSTKAALKEAKDCIGQKDYKSALKCCKRVLNVDKENYFAWVFVGLCQSKLKEKDSAKKAYERAIAKEPEQVTAWEGLVSFYAENPDDFPVDRTKALAALAEVYWKAGDHKKYYDTSTKQWQAYQGQKDVASAVRALQGQIEKLNEVEHGKLKEARGNLIKFLNQEPDLSGELSQVLATALEDGITDSDTIQNMENLTSYIKVLYKMRDMEKLFQVALRMQKISPKFNYPYEWICKVYLEWVTDTLDFNHQGFQDIQRLVGILLQMSPMSTLGLLSQGALKWHLGELQEALDILRGVLDGNANPNFYGSYILCDTLVKLKMYSDAERQISVTLLNIGKVKEESTRSGMERQLHKLMITSLYNQWSSEKMLEAKTILDGMAALDKDLRVFSLKIRAFLGEDIETDLAQNTLDIPVDERTFLEAIAYKSRGQLKEAQHLLEGFVQSHPDHSEALIALGQVEFEGGQRDQSLTRFLKAAKLNPSNPLPFLYLGHHYRSLKDLDKARKCYQKCFQLNPFSEETGAALSDIYREQGLDENNLQFLTSVTKGSASRTNRWAFLRLGILYLSRNDPTNAILSLQSALRSDAEDANAWEGLADAYQARGSYNAALRAYDKVLQLNPGSVYTQWQIGTIKHILGDQWTAIEAFEKILHGEPGYVPALKGLGDSLVSQARDFLADGINQTAVVNCQRALEHLTQAAESRPDISCLWKLMGEACTLIHPLPAAMVRMKIPQALAVNGERELSKYGILSLGARCYLQALNNNPEDPQVWHDLALNYHCQAESGTSEEQALLRQRATVAIKKAIKLQPKGHSHWSLFGVVALKAENYALAQHAFIRSIEAENNAMAWTNLGILYLMKGEQELANKSFQEAQNHDPSYLRGWVGQAILAETMAYHSEAMDLFRHACFLGNEPEASIGYANWICKTMKSLEDQNNPTHAHNVYCIKNMFGVSVASDCLTRYTEIVPDDACALNMLGVLLEREGVLQPSRKALEKALSVVSTIGQRDWEASIRINLARVGFKLHDYSGSIGHYSLLPPSFPVLCGLAISHYKVGHFQESYVSYQSALNLAGSNEEKSHVLAALASIAYQFQGGEAAKTLLFQSCQLQPPSVQGLFALCVLGIKQKNIQLIQSALEAMQPYQDHPKYLAEVVGLQALVSMLLQGDSGHQAKGMICRQVHRNPQSASLWFTLATHLLHTAASNQSAYQSAAKCAQKSVGLSSIHLPGILEPHEQHKSTPTAASNLVTLALLESGSREAARKAAMRAVHLYPNDMGAWSLLWVAQGKTDKNLGDFLANQAQEHLEVDATPGLGDWLSKLKTLRG